MPSPSQSTTHGRARTPHSPGLRDLSSRHGDGLGGTSVFAAASFGSFGLPSLRNQTTLPFSAADDQVRLAVAVPVRDDRGRGAAGDRDRLAAGGERLRLAEHRLAAGADVGREQDFAARGADDEVELAVAVPVEREHVRPVGRVDRLAVRVLERLAAGEPVAVAPEQVIGPGHEPEMTSGLPSPSRSTNCGQKPMYHPGRDGAERVAGLEPLEVAELRFLRRADVPVDAELAAVELADEQVRLAVAVEVADERGGVPAALDVDRLAVGGDVHRRREVRRQPRRPRRRARERARAQTASASRDHEDSSLTSALHRLERGFQVVDHRRRVPVRDGQPLAGAVEGEVVTARGEFDPAEFLPRSPASQHAGRRTSCRSRVDTISASRVPSGENPTSLAHEPGEVVCQSTFFVARSQTAVWCSFALRVARAPRRAGASRSACRGRRPPAACRPARGPARRRRSDRPRTSPAPSRSSTSKTWTTL